MLGHMRCAFCGIPGSTAVKASRQELTYTVKPALSTALTLPWLHLQSGSVTAKKPVPSTLTPLVTPVPHVTSCLAQPAYCAQLKADH